MERTFWIVNNNILFSIGFFESVLLFQVKSNMLTNNICKLLCWILIVDKNWAWKLSFRKNEVSQRKCKGSEDSLPLVKSTMIFSDRLHLISKYRTKTFEFKMLTHSTFSLQSLAIYNGAEKWFPLCSLNQNRSSSTKARGDILLGFKVQFKLVSSSNKTHLQNSNV